MVKNKNALWLDIFQFRAILAPSIALKCKKLHPEIEENPPPTRGDLTSVSKNSKLYLQISTGEIEKASQAKIGTIFT